MSYTVEIKATTGSEGGREAAIIEAASLVDAIEAVGARNAVIREGGEVVLSVRGVGREPRYYDAAGDEIHVDDTSDATKIAAAARRKAKEAEIAPKKARRA